MTEMWREPYENQKLQLLEELNVVFEAANLGYLYEEKNMTEGICGKPIYGYQDNVLRVTLANWFNKSRIVIEKPLEGANEDFTKSIFADEDKPIAFSLYIFDLLQDDIAVPEYKGINGSVEHLRIEVYEDGRLALMYFGRPTFEGNANYDDEFRFDSSGDYEDCGGEEEYATFQTSSSSFGAVLLGVDYTEQGNTTHAQLVDYIRSELALDIWHDRYQQSLETSMDTFIRSIGGREE